MAVPGAAWNQVRGVFTPQPGRPRHRGVNSPADADCGYLADPTGAIGTPPARAIRPRALEFRPVAMATPAQPGEGLEEIEQAMARGRAADRDGGLI